MTMGTMATASFDKAKTMVSSMLNSALKETADVKDGFNEFQGLFVHDEVIIEKTAAGAYKGEYPILGTSKSPTDLDKLIADDFVEALLEWEMNKVQAVLLEFDERELKKNAYVRDRVDTAITSIILADEQRLIDMIIYGHTANSYNHNRSTWIGSTDYFYANDHSWNISGANDNLLTYTVGATLPTVTEMLVAWNTIVATFMGFKNDQGRQIHRQLGKTMICCSPIMIGLFKETFEAYSHYRAGYAKENVYMKDAPTIWADSRFTDSHNNASFWVFVQAKPPALVKSIVEKPYTRMWTVEPQELTYVKAADFQEYVYGDFRNSIRMFDSGA